MASTRNWPRVTVPVSPDMLLRLKSRAAKNQRPVGRELSVLASRVLASEDAAPEPVHPTGASATITA